MRPTEDIIRVAQKNDYKTVVGEIEEKGIHLESFIYLPNRLFCMC